MRHPLRHIDAHPCCAIEGCAQRRGASVQLAASRRALPLPILHQGRSQHERDALRTELPVEVPREPSTIPQARALLVHLGDVCGVTHQGRPRRGRQSGRASGTRSDRSWGLHRHRPSRAGSGRACEASDIPPTLSVHVGEVLLLTASNEVTWANAGRDVASVHNHHPFRDRAENHLEHHAMGLGGASVHVDDPVATMP